MPKYNAFKPALGFEGRVFSQYQHQIKMQAVLLSKIRSALPAHLSKHALYCVLTNKRISLYTDSAIWSSQLRFYHQTILHTLLSSHEGVIESLQVKIIPQVVEPQKEQPTPKKIPSIANINFILKQADQQTDITLKNSLQRLGKTFQRKKKDHPLKNE